MDYVLRRGVGFYLHSDVVELAAVMLLLCIWLVLRVNALEQKNAKLEIECHSLLADNTRLSKKIGDSRPAQWTDVMNVGLWSRFKMFVSA